MRVHELNTCATPCSREDREVHGREELVVADLHGELPFAREGREELVEPGGESPRHRCRSTWRESGTRRRTVPRCRRSVAGRAGKSPPRTGRGSGKSGFIFPARAGSCALVKVWTVSWLQTLLTTGKARRQVLGVAPKHRLGGWTVVGSSRFLPCGRAEMRRTPPASSPAAPLGP